MVTEGRRDVGRNVNAHHALKRLALGRQRQHSGGLARVAARNLEVNTHLDFVAVEFSYQRSDLLKSPQVPAPGCSVFLLQRG